MGARRRRVKREAVKKEMDSAIKKVKLLCQKFHVVARTLGKRYDKRTALEIEDEHDVQNLLHALLKIFFDDIRTEEWTPSYAGSSSRMDFLLKKEGIVIETKKTRKGLSDKEIGEQLWIDIGKYKTHPDCKTLICFVYDTEGRVRNPKGLESDLIPSSNDQLNVIVIVEPS